MKVLTTSRAVRTILLRLEDNDLLPEAVAIGLEVEGIQAGWLRGSGVLSDVEVRAGEEIRKVGGIVMAISVESSIAGGRDSVVLRGVFARDTGASLETFAGELVRARVLSLDVVITALEDATVERAPAPAPERKPPAPAPAPAWTAAADASARAPEPSPKPQPVLVRNEMPVPPKIRRAEAEVDQPFPEAGDVVEHFAFGRCEVIKSDGDRLHVKLARDGRIREIALEMLKVSTMEPDGGHKRYRLDRKL